MFLYGNPLLYIYPSSIFYILPLWTIPFTVVDIFKGFTHKNLVIFSSYIFCFYNARTAKYIKTMKCACITENREQGKQQQGRLRVGVAETIKLVTVLFSAAIFELWKFWLSAYIFAFFWGSMWVCGACECVYVCVLCLCLCVCAVYVASFECLNRNANRKQQQKRKNWFTYDSQNAFVLVCVRSVCVCAVCVCLVRLPFVRLFLCWQEKHFPQIIDYQNYIKNATKKREMEWGDRKSWWGAGGDG